MEPGNYVTLAVARNLTTYADTRIPEQLPADPAARQQALDDLRTVTGEYAKRAHREAILDAGSSPESVVSNARTIADEANMVVRSWSEMGAPPEAGTSAVADPAVDALVIALLTWRLAAYPVPENEVYISDAIAAATYAAGEARVLYLAPAAGPAEPTTGHTGDA